MCSNAHQSPGCWSHVTAVGLVENASQETTCSSQRFSSSILCFVPTALAALSKSTQSTLRCRTRLAFDPHRFFISIIFWGGRGGGPRTRSVTNFLVMTDAVKRQSKSQASSLCHDHNARAAHHSPSLGTFVPKQTYACPRQ